MTYQKFLLENHITSIGSKCNVALLIYIESVSEGHPDKVADQISDAILDAMLEQDPHSRVACETMVTTGQVVVAGEITSKASVDIQRIVRDTIADIGYEDPEYGFDYRSCGVLVALDQQSPDISQGVSEEKVCTPSRGRVIRA